MAGDGADVAVLVFLIYFCSQGNRKGGVNYETQIIWST